MVLTWEITRRYHHALIWFYPTVWSLNCKWLSLMQAAIMRIGLREMRVFSKLIFPSVSDATFFESCGVADVITTCCMYYMQLVYDQTVHVHHHEILESSSTSKTLCQIILSSLRLHCLKLASFHTIERLSSQMLCVQWVAETERWQKPSPDVPGKGPDKHS